MLIGTALAFDLGGVSYGALVDTAAAMPSAAYASESTGTMHFAFEVLRCRISAALAVLLRWTGMGTTADAILLGLVALGRVPGRRPSGRGAPQGLPTPTLPDPHG